MIRDAVEADLGALLQIGRDFFAANGAADLLPWDEDTACDVLCGILTGESEGCLLVAVDDLGVIQGATGAVFFPSMWNRHNKAGIELFLRAARGHGGELLAALEERARAAGVRTFGMLCLDAMRPEAVGALYERRGYRATERVFVKRLQ